MRIAALSSIRTQARSGGGCRWHQGQTESVEELERSGGMGHVRMITPSARFHSMFWDSGGGVEAVVLEIAEDDVEPSSRRLFSMALATVAKNHRVRKGATTPTTRVRPEAKVVAAGEATSCRSSVSRSTRSRTAG